MGMTKMGMTKTCRSLAAAVATLAFFALGACSSMMDRDTSSGGSGGVTSGGAASTTGATPSPASSSPSRLDTTMPAGTPSDTSSAQMPPATPSAVSPPGAATAMPADANSISAYGVVQAIDPVPRSQTMAVDSAGAMPPTSGGSGTAATGGAGSDMVYRVTVRLDDGTMKAVTQETTPTYQIGDRVRLASGTIQRQ